MTLVRLRENIHWVGGFQLLVTSSFFSFFILFSGWGSGVPGQARGPVFRVPGAPASKKGYTNPEFYTKKGP